jgi:hypothetical protein
MTSKPFAFALAAWLLLPAATYAEESLRDSLGSSDFLRTTFTQTGAMDIDGNSGDLSITKFQATAFLSKPIALTPDLTMLPMFSYGITQLDFSGTGPLPIEDEGLHSASLSAIFTQDFRNSPWFAMGWTSAEMATDYQGLSGDDFTFDVALGMGYRVSDTLMISAGFVVINLNGDEEIFPGINFSWKPCDAFSLALFGPKLLARYDINDSWYISLNGTPGGGSWNIDDSTGQSRTIELDSYWIGLNTHHRITGEFWVSAGIGYTFANQIEIKGNHGNGPSLERDMDGAALAQISLSLRSW